MAGVLILELDEENFDAEIQQRPGPILVDFWTAWCGPCKTLAPALAELALEFEGRACIAKVDVDASGDLADRFGIRSVPTLMVFKHGKVVDQLVGAAPKAEIVRLIQKYLGDGMPGR